MVAVPSVDRRHGRLAAVGLVFALLLAGGVVGAEPDAAGTNATTVSPAVLDGHGEQVVLVYFESDSAGPDTSASDTADLSVSQFEERAAAAQQPLVQHAAATPGVTVERTFWLGNVAAVTVDHGRANVTALAAIEGVEHVGPNAEVRVLTAGTDAGQAGSSLPSLHGPASPTLDSSDTATAESSSDKTYGLDQIDAPEVWSTYGTTGEGTTVAVLDTGVNASHPDIDVATFAEFDENGDIVGTDPYDSDSNGHGTHVSGTVVGGDASGTHIGVAPGADLMHGLVLPEGEGTLTQIIAGMEWAVEHDADVISMSLGGNAYIDDLVAPVRDARNAGTMVVAASGNDGAGTSHSPGNVYDAISVGASDAEEGIADFSGGEVVERSSWSDPPGDWPSEWIAPKISAPGVAVESTLPNGGYEKLSGTSMATPHVAGAVALIQSATGENLTVAEIETALAETAFKPAGVPPDPDTRYGHGIVDVKAAVDSLSDEEPDPPQFAVTIDATNSPVSEGETLTVDATVENTGGQSDTQPVVLEVGGTLIDSTEVTLAAGEARTVTLEWATGTGDGGDYSAAVFSEDDIDSAGVTVEAPTPADFTVTVDGTNSPVTEGETLAVDATVENTGDEADTQTVVLDIDGRRDSTEVTLGSGESRTVSLEWATGTGDGGDYSALVASADDSDSASVSVRKAAAFTVSIAGTNSPVIGGDTLTVDATVENTGDKADTQTVELDVAGERDATEVTLAGGESRTVSLEWETTPEDNGSYAALVASDDDTDTTDVTIREPGLFVVSVVETNSPVVSGDTLTVDALVASTVDGTDTQRIRLTTDGTERDATNVTLDRGETSRVSFAWNTTGDDVGRYAAAVASETDADERAVTVEKPGDFRVGITDTNAPVTEGETLTVDAVVENAGNGTATQTVTLSVNGTRLSARTVTLGPGETTGVSFAWDTTGGDAGERTVTVASEDSADSAAVVVEGAVPVDVAITATNAPVVAGETVTVDATVENVGEENTAQQVVLRVTGTERDSSTILLTPGSTTDVTLAWQTAPGDAGNRTVTVASIHDAETVTVVVESSGPRVADYTNGDDVVDTDGLRAAIDDWRADAVDTDLLRDVIDAWRSGEPVA